MSTSQEAAIETVRNELANARDIAWKIFSWTSSILTAIAGGVIALKSGSDPKQLNLYIQILISISVMVLAVYAVGWIRLHSFVQIKLEAILINKAYEQNINIGTIEDAPLPKIGFREAIYVLSVAAILVVWVPI